VRIVVSLGATALPPGDAREAVSVLAAVARRHELVVTHGNGPEPMPARPLDVAEAQSQGMVGYRLVQALRNALPGRNVVGVLTEVEVSATDPAFTRPTKAIGPTYTQADAERLAADHGWSIAREGPAFRRVVASPEPLRIVELEAVEQLLAAGDVVVCAGGGGIPVTVAGRSIRGAEAIIDEDLTAALLAAALGADLLVLLADAPPAPARERTTPAELRRLQFSAGAMQPKIDAACRFVERTGYEAAIGALEELAEVVAGTRGTRVAPAAPYPPHTRRTAIKARTRDNILTAMRGEAYAHARYRVFAKAAHDSSDRDLEEMFEGIAAVELREHFAELAELVQLVGADADNIQCAIHDESDEVEVTYRLFADQARADGEDEVAARFDEIREDELAHLKTLETALERLQLPA
jgi:carbamate kinase